MRSLVTVPVVTILAVGVSWCGCAKSPPLRLARPSLTGSLKTLAGRDVVAEGAGPWLVRRFEGAAGADEGGGASFGFDFRAAGAPLAAPPDRGRAGADPAPGGLRAGSTDDNVDFAAFLVYLAAQQSVARFSKLEQLDVADRRSVRVVDPNGGPLPGAAVQIVDADRDVVLWHGTTFGDGRVPFYPSLLDAAAPRTYLLEVERDGASVRQHWNGRGEECVVTLPNFAGVAAEIALDVVFLIDTTGSMGDEIDRIKASLLGVTDKLRRLEREFDLRYGAVLYRDLGDAYVTKAHPFTGDIVAFDRALQTIEAQGGGDSPESLNQGLAVAIDWMEWRPAAAKIVFLVADAPPHMDYDGDVSYGVSLRAAIARGIRIHAVAASGLDGVGTLVFRQIAQFTRGKFIFIEYGGDIDATAEGHGVAGQIRSNNLDEILLEQIRAEIAAWGRNAR